MPWLRYLAQMRWPCRTPRLMRWAACFWELAFFFEPPNEADAVAISYIGLLFFELLQLVDGLGYFGSVIHRQSYDLLILNQY